MVKKQTALAKMWRDSLDIIVHEGVENPENGRTQFVEKTLYRNIPCRLSFRTPAQAIRVARTHGEYVTEIEQTVQLFLSPEVFIPPGSKIVVYHQGRKIEFARSGEPAIFDRHQEVRVERFTRWA